MLQTDNAMCITSVYTAQVKVATIYYDTQMCPHPGAFLDLFQKYQEN